MAGHDQIQEHLLQLVPIAVCTRKIGVGGQVGMLLDMVSDHLGAHEVNLPLSEKAKPKRIEVKVGD
jgi:hypothetical protein